MKKIFTLISMALVAMSVNAQDVYNAIVDGKLNTEFAAVAGEGGGVANNAADGKSIVTITVGKATVTAVGGTTPANDANVGGAAQQIVPGAAIEGKENTYEVAQVNAWSDISWGLKNQGDIDFWYITGTGNPYVKMNCIQNSKDGELVPNSFKADYIYYEPDGSVGLPITGLYYKFTASAAGAFKVKVWANKGTRKTFVVNANTMKAERLLASGYINGVNDADGKKKLLTVDQVDSVHNDWLGAQYTSALNNFKKEPEKYADPGDSAAYVKKLSEEDGYQYVIGNGGQNFWGWLTFDVEPGEEYWVFQHSSQIGFGGFEFYEGKTADELINDIVVPYVYTTNFSTYEDETTGERVTWKGEKAVGAGQFASEEPRTDDNGKALNIVPFGDFYRNDGTAKRTSYCLLPEDVLAHSDKTQELTIAVWVRSQKGTESNNYKFVPLLTAYAAAPVNGINTWPMMACQYRGLLQVNCNGWSDFTDAQNVAGKNTEYNGEADWLKDHKWHHYAAVFEGENAKVFIDGVLKNEWDATKVAERTQKGLFSNGADLKYVCLGGNQAWDWNDNDAPFDFARLLIKNSKMTAGEIAAQMKADVGDTDMEAYYAESGEETGINAIKTTQNSNAAIYNLAGQKVSNDFKGIVIQNGRKMIQK